MELIAEYFAFPASSTSGKEYFVSLTRLYDQVMLTGVTRPSVVFPADLLDSPILDLPSGDRYLNRNDRNKARKLADQLVRLHNEMFPGTPSVRAASTVGMLNHRLK